MLCAQAARLLQASIQPSPPRSRRLPQRLPGRRRLVAVAARKKEGAPEEELSQAHPTGSGEEGEVPSGPAAGEAPLEAGGEAPPAGEAQQAQHPGASSAPLMQEKHEFEGTGGVLLDVSHTTPKPYHGEGVGRREDVHAEPHQETAAGPPGGRASEETEADRVKGEGAAEGEEAAAE